MDEKIEVQEWTEEDIEKYNMGVQRGKDDRKKDIHPGATMLGIFLAFLSMYFIYIQEYVFGLFLVSLIVVLAIASMVINRM